MRVAPIGLVAPSKENGPSVFKLATGVAQLTHGHPAGSLSAGYFSLTIAGVLRGLTLHLALEEADSELLRHSGCDEVRRAIDCARTLAARGRPTPEQLEGLGSGWVAEEALAIAVCSALVATDFSDGVLLAVNHSGGSTSTGSLAGNLLGALYGVKAIPHAWLDTVEIRHVIERMATDLYDVSCGGSNAAQVMEAYPPY